MARLLLKVYPRNIKIRNNATVLHWWLKKYSTCNVPTQCDSTILVSLRVRSTNAEKNTAYVPLALVCEPTLKRYNAGEITLHRSTSKISHSCVRKPFVIRLAQHKTHAQHLTHVQHPVYGPFGNVVRHLNIELCWRSLTLST